jgi:hypothetical protein
MVNILIDKARFASFNLEKSSNDIFVFEFESGTTSHAITVEVLPTTTILII